MSDRKYEMKRERERWMDRDRLEIYRHSVSWTCGWNDKYCWHLASRVCYSKFILLPIYRECWALRTELFEMMSLASHFQNNRLSSSSSYDTVPTGEFGGDYWRQTLAEFRPSCNYFASLCQNCWVKTGCCEKAGQTGRREKGGQICCDIKWKAY